MSSLSRPAFIDTLHDRVIHQPLPGIPAHLRMAHAVRKVEPTIRKDETRDAAVLICLYEKSAGGMHLVFIRRGSGHDSDKHAGQIAFPGGKRDPEDRDLMYTALREANEEVGLDLTTVDVLGPITPLYITVSKFMVHPYVAFLTQPPILTRQESEIEEILELPLAAIRSADVRQSTKIRLASGITLNHVPCFQVDNHIIWGATAMILNEFLEIIS